MPEVLPGVPQVLPGAPQVLPGALEVLPGAPEVLPGLLLDVPVDSSVLGHQFLCPLYNLRDKKFMNI